MTFPDNSTAAAGIVLASTSPYRRQLLERTGLTFNQEAPDTEERRIKGEPAEDMVRRLAASKAEAVAARHSSGLVIGSDQCALRDNDILGKPGTVEAAVQQLQAASGKTIRFLTAMCVIDAGSGQRVEHIDITEVVFRQLDEAAIRRYVEAEMPLDCAGSFKSEALGISLFEAIRNDDPSALMGLPLIALCRILREFGVQLP